MIKEEMLPDCGAGEDWCGRVPCTARRSNQSVLKEIDLEYSLEELMLKLKLQYFDHLMRRATLLEKTLMLGKIEGRGRRGWQRMNWLGGIIDSVQFSSDAQSCPTLCSKEQIWLSDWTTNNNLCISLLLYCKHLASGSMSRWFTFIFKCLAQHLAYTRW